MRGRQEPQVPMLAFVDLEERVPADHPLRAISGRRSTLALAVVEFVSHSLALGLGWLNFGQLTFSPGSLDVFAVEPR